MMKLKKWAWIGGLALFFLLLPSFTVKLWDFLTLAPWPQKSWLVYLLVSFGVIGLVRWRMRRISSKEQNPVPSDTQLLYFAKERLAKGEITPEEYREIRRELN